MRAFGGRDPPMAHLYRLTVAIALGGCALPSAARLSLPPTQAPLEERIRAYRRNSVTARVSFFGLRARVGEAPEPVRFSEAESVLVNAPAARALFEERNDRRLLGWSLYGAGLALMLGDAAWMLSNAGRGTTPSDWAVPFAAVLGIGAAIAIV